MVARDDVVIGAVDDEDWVLRPGDIALSGVIEVRQ